MILFVILWIVDIYIYTYIYIYIYNIYMLYTYICILYIYIYIFENIRTFWHIKTWYSWISWILDLTCAHTPCSTNSSTPKCVEFVVRNTCNRSIETFLHKKVCRKTWYSSKHIWELCQFFLSDFWAQIV